MLECMAHETLGNCVEMPASQSTADSTLFVPQTKFNSIYTGELCNGSTTDSDSVCWGSNPYSPAKRKQTIIRWSVFFSFWLGDRGFSPQLAKRAGFAYPDRRLTSSLVRRRERVSSPQANTPIPTTIIRWSVFFSFWLGDRGFSPQRRKARGSHSPRRARRACS